MYIPRDLNYVVDDIAKITDFDDYIHATGQGVQLYWRHLGALTHAIDSLVIIILAQKIQYKVFWPGTNGVNPGTQNWSQDNIWLCSTTSLVISRSNNHAKTCKAQWRLILPVWKSSPFWHVLFEDCLFLPNFPKLFLKFKTKNDVSGNKPFKFETVALRINFSSTTVAGPLYELFHISTLKTTELSSVLGAALHKMVSSPTSARANVHECSGPSAHW